MTNVLLMAERRRRISAEDVKLAFELLGRLPIIVETQESTSMSSVYQLARERRLSAYDACNLDLARQRRSPLATLDRNLKAAARPAKVRLL